MHGGVDSRSDSRRYKELVAYSNRNRGQIVADQADALAAHPSGNQQGESYRLKVIVMKMVKGNSST